MRLFGRNRDAQPEPAELTDEQALARYRYMLATAPPEEIERAHEEAFAQLSPEQRRQALLALSRHVPPSEIRGDDPASLARVATRAEIRQPGTIERAWGSGAPGFGLGSWFLTTLAGSFIGTAIAQSFFDSDPGAAEAADASAGAEDGAASEAGWSDQNAGDFGSEAGEAGEAGDFGGGDFGGGDFGGGDFGGGDFGGGDFGGI
jgi:hypothetical protein